MLDTRHLRSTVSSGRYVIDPFAVADALLARAGIATAALEPHAPAGEAVSPDGARTRPAPEPPLRPE